MVSKARGVRDWLILIAAIAAILIVSTDLEPEPPRADAARYLNYSVNVLEHGVFGLSEGADAAPVAPGRANVPLYPAFAAGVFHLFDVPASALRCYLGQTPEQCSTLPMQQLARVQLIVATLTVSLIACAANLLFGMRGAWFAAGAALLSGEPQDLAGQLLTENFSLLFCVLLTVLILLNRNPRHRLSLGMGLVTGALCLTRPEFLYLFVAIAAVALVRSLRLQPRAVFAQQFGLLLLGFALVCGPWMARNYYHFGDPALTQSYSGYVLAQRVAYNQMSMTEWASAFIYWLPDFGDSLAERLLPPGNYLRLDFGPASYYKLGDKLQVALAERLGGPAGVTSYLLRHEVIGNPVKHALVTLALAWRGVFVAKLWGLVALLAFVAALWRFPRQRHDLLRCSAPWWFMLMFYAAVSVSIPRYAICFLAVFSIAWASMLLRPDKLS